MGAGFYREANKARQQHRADNRAEAARILDDRGIAYKPQNNGSHFVLTVGAEIIDFWPGSGKWQVRGSAEVQRGVYRLVTYVRG